MSYRRVSQIRCDRCSAAAELTPVNTAGGRAVKPVGWARISISAKLDAGKPVQVIHTGDLCPSCSKLTRDFVTDQTPEEQK